MSTAVRTTASPPAPRRPWTSVDPLGEALHAVRMNGVFYCRSELTAPWVLEMPPFEGCLSFHVVTAGGCWLEMEGIEATYLRPGDFALVPHGQGHRIAYEPGMPEGERVDLMPQELISEHYSILRCGGGGARTTLVCGVVAFELPIARQLVRMLPQVIHVDSTDSHRTDRMRGALELMVGEMRELSPGGEAVTTRLADILVIESVRTWLQDESHAQQGWLAALRDERIGRALAAVHRDPAAQWTLASLAREAAMSRSAFAARFTRLVGEPVMQYVTRWRMNLALSWLREEGATVAEVAPRLGYASDAAFSRAFKATLGIPPGAARRGGLPLPTSGEGH